MKFKIFLRPETIVIPLALITLGLLGCAGSPEARSAKFMTAGKKLLQNNNPARALLEFQNAARVTPKSSDVYYQLGVAYLALGDLRNGVAGLRKSLELNPKNTGAQLRLAQLMAGASDPKFVRDAQQRLESLLRDAPDNPDALHALA